MADISAEAMEAGRKWCDIFQVLKKKYLLNQNSTSRETGRTEMQEKSRLSQMKKNKNN